MTRTILLCLSLGLAMVATSSRAESIQLPPETATFKAGPGVDVVNAQCLVCHSAEYVSIQSPNRPRSYWHGVVMKMKKTFGAQIPDDQIEPIVNYLVQTYGDGK
jgi:sulfite dehydrogenase